MGNAMLEQSTSAPTLSPQSTLANLTTTSTSIFAAAFKTPRIEPILTRILRPLARNAAFHALEFDRIAGECHNLQAPSRNLVERVSDLPRVYGVEKIPARGPVIITSNHPGIIDAMLLFASIPRTDVKVIARPGHFLDALPNIRRHVIMLPEGDTLAAIRESLRFLANGGLIVTFPNGGIEADPLIHLESAQHSLEAWSPSLNLLAKYVQNLTIIPAAVGGVLSMPARESWLARRYRTEANRDWVAATLQFLLPAYRHTRPIVVYGAPVTSGDPLAQVVAATRGLYEEMIKTPYNNGIHERQKS
jgi:hypothetical protein